VFVDDNKYYAFNQLFKRQREREWICLDNLWTQESQWNADAQNPESTAYGIAQFIDQTWNQTGINKTDDPKKQIEAGLIYIEQRYDSSPCLAWEHSQRKGYY
jgi:membrane-bound lytic murein transglycosylase MltF